MKLKYNFVVREVGGTVMAVAVEKGNENFNGLVKLNDTARFIFEALNEDVTEEQLTDKLTDEYEVSREEAAASVSSFVAKLRENGLLTD